MPVDPMRQRTLGDEAMNAFWCLVSLGLIDREQRIAQASLDEERQ